MITRAGIKLLLLTVKLHCTRVASNSRLIANYNHLFPSSKYMRYLVLSVGYMHRFYRISMGLRVTASSGIDNREASYESFF